MTKSKTTSSARSSKKYVLGWTEIDAIPERVRDADADGDDAIRDWVTEWLEERRSLLAAVRSQVLPGALLRESDAPT